MTPRTLTHALLCAIVAAGAWAYLGAMLLRWVITANRVDRERVAHVNRQNMDMEIGV